MGKHAQLILGPAGVGKSTYCSMIQRHCEAIRRNVHCINLDPGAEIFEYSASIDVRKLITVDEVMEAFKCGPNGALVLAMEHLSSNIDWFGKKLGDFDDDYLLIDCPGQMELYTHLDAINIIVSYLVDLGYSICCVFLMDSHFMTDSGKFIAGTMMALSAMTRLELPHINVLTKMDLTKEKHLLGDFDPQSQFPDDGESVPFGRDLEPYDEYAERGFERFFFPDTSFLLQQLNRDCSPRFCKLNAAVADLLDEYNMVHFIPLDITDEESLEYVLSVVDHAIQYGEDKEVMIPRDLDE